MDATDPTPSGNRVTDADGLEEPGGSGGSRFPGPPGWRVVVLDLVVVAAWVGTVTYGWGLFRWPTWAYYVVVFAGIAGYSIVDDPWGASEDGSQ